MSEITLLRQNAIVRKASVGESPPHGAVKTGELPLVHVKQSPGGPQVRESQQKAVTILPPKDAESAVKTGGLPMVKVKMTDGKAKPDDGHDNPVVIRDNRQTVAAGQLPMVEVKMENGRPQVKTAPNVAAGPPQIPSAAPALSAPRVAQAAIGPRVTRVAAPRPVLSAPPLPEVPTFTTDQWMLCRHLVDKYLDDLRAASSAEIAAREGGDDSGTEVVASDAAILAASTLAAIDDTLVAIAVRAEAAANAEVTASAPIPNAYVAPRPETGGHFSPASIAPSAPQTGYVAQRPGMRTHVAGGRTQGHASMAPRRVQRSASSEPLPPVIVKMDGQRPVVQPTPISTNAVPTVDATTDPQG